MSKRLLPWSMQALHAAVTGARGAVRHDGRTGRRGTADSGTSAGRCGSEKVADVVGYIDRVFAQDLHRYHFQGILMGRRQHHRCGDTVLVRV